MSLVNSKNIELGSPIPPFRLQDTSGKIFLSGDVFGKKGLLIAFTCNHCPYAVAIWPRLIQLSKFGKEIGINTLAINPNIHPDYPEDSPLHMEIKIREWAIPFPYLVDDTQSVAKDFDAQCTPDLYLYDAKTNLYYHGRLDDNWKNPLKVKREELKNAMIALAEGKPAPQIQHASMGCSIKWK